MARALNSGSQCAFPVDAVNAVSKGQILSQFLFGRKYVYIHYPMEQEALLHFHVYGRRNTVLGIANPGCVAISSTHVVAAENVHSILIIPICHMAIPRLSANLLL